MAPAAAFEAAGSWEGPSEPRRMTESELRDEPLPDSYLEIQARAFRVMGFIGVALRTPRDLTATTATTASKCDRS